MCQNGVGSPICKLCSAGALPTCTHHCERAVVVRVVAVVNAEGDRVSARLSKLVGDLDPASLTAVLSTVVVGARSYRGRRDRENRR